MGETPKKYHVTDEGDVFRINEDGSFTSMGNAEKMSEQKTEETKAEQDSVPSPDSAPSKPAAKKSSDKRMLLYFMLFLAIVLAGALAYFFLSPNGIPADQAAVPDKPPTEDSIAVAQTAETDVTQGKAPAQDVVPQAQEGAYLQPGQAIEPKETQAAVSYEKAAESQPKVETNIESTYKPDKFETKPSNTIDPDKVYYSVEVQAQFPGGDRAKTRWLNDNISWPRDANGNPLQGDVELEFIIERDGSISNVKVTYSENPDLNSAAVRLISSMPKWSPAKVRNQPVRSPMGITLFF